jgi:hypothetical protein
VNKHPRRRYGQANCRQLLEWDPTEALSVSQRRRPAHLSLFASILLAWRRNAGEPSPRFAKYQPALRLGTRKVEQRLLDRLARTQLESAR